MEDKVNERLAVIDNLLDLHDKRLDRHDAKLTDLQGQNIKQDALLEKLRQNQEKTIKQTEQNSKTLDEIHAQGKTIKWLVTSIVTGVPALVSLYFALKQVGLFGG